MGEVYRARDTKLGREVAIKVLPEEVSKDRERLSRFEREAKLLASLNHPAIATLYGFEDDYLVMELVEGETLGERIARGPLPLDEAVPLFIHIAEGLEAAHEKRIIHRDLKPANIMIGTDGNPKILDFGLAKAFLPEEGVSAETSQSPTLTKGTALGTIMGTASYMSPEQARGKKVDKRTDIWAFGCCLYEALTRKKAFDGETVSDIIGAVMRAEPEWSALPAAGRALVKRCLVKDPRQRLRDIGDARIELGDDKSGAPAMAPGRSGGVPWLAAAAMIAAAVLATWFAKPSDAPRDLPVFNVRLGLQPAEKLRQSVFDIEYPLARPAMALSDDGQLLAFTAGAGARPDLYLRRLDETEAVMIPGTNGAVGPFFSPDSQWIGFWTDGELKKVRIDGGPAQKLCDVAVLPNGATWGRDGTILFGASERGIFRVSTEGGTPEPVTTVKEGDGGHGLPYFLPGGNAIVYTLAPPEPGLAGHRTERARLVVESLQTGERNVLVENAADGRYVPTGHLVFLRLGTLMAAPFDPRRRELTGVPMAVRDGILQDINNTLLDTNKGAGQFGFSSTGWLAYVPGRLPTPPETQLAWIDRDGTSDRIQAPSGSYWSPRIAPDGRRIAVNKDEASIWTYDIPGRTWSQVTPAESTEFLLTWSPENEITFESDRDGAGFGIYRQTIDRGGSVEQLTPAGPFRPVSWSPDGQVLALVRQSTDKSDDLWMLPTDGTPEPFKESEATLWWPEFSPNGRWLAYSSDESGQMEVYVEPYPGPGPIIQIPTEGGGAPAWARNGEELFYSRFIEGDPEGKTEMWSVDVTEGTELRVGQPRLLFRTERMRNSAATRSYDVTPDGQRFLIVVPEERVLPEFTEVHLVVNWFEELNRLAPTN